MVTLNLKYKWVFDLLNLTVWISVSVALSFPFSFPSPSFAQTQWYQPVLAVGETSHLMVSKFQKAQRAELRNLDKKDKLEQKSLKTTQKARLRKWEEDEKKARYEYFETHVKGPDRRSYIQEFLQRREKLLQEMKEEKAKLTQTQEVRRKQLKMEQAENFEKFQKSIDSGETPSQELWPR